MIFEHLTWPKNILFQAYTYVASVSKMIYDYGPEQQTEDFWDKFRFMLHYVRFTTWLQFSTFVLLSYFYRGNFLWVWKPPPVWNDI